MKHITLSSLLLFFSLFSLSAQTANSKKAFTEVKRAKLIIGMSGDEAMDAALRTAVDSFWTYSRLDGREMPYKEALAEAQGDDRTMVLYIDKMKSETSILGSAFNGDGSPNMNRSWMPGPASKSLILTISGGKNLKKHMKAFVAVPTGEDGSVPPAAIHFGVATLQDMGQTIGRAPKKPMAHYKSTLEKRGRRLKSKTLYVLEDFFGKKYGPEEFTDTYGFKVEVVDLARWSEVILNQEEGAAYAIVSPVPISGKHVYVHYLVDAETGRTMGAAYPPVALSLGPVNLSKGNSWTINKKVATKYHDAVAGK